VSHTTRTALILAGQRVGAKDPLCDSKYPHKAFIEIAGKSMLSRVIEALKNSNQFKKIIVAVPDQLETHFADLIGNDPIVQVRISAVSPATSMLEVLESLSENATIMTTTCDHPLLTSEMVNYFLSSVEEKHHHVAVGCVSRKIFETDYPTAKRTFIKLQDISFSGANMFWLKAGGANPLLQFWKRLEDNRKKPLKMASEIGVITAARYLSGRLSKRGLLETIERKTGVCAELIELPFAQAAIDVDKAADIEIVESLLRGK